MEHTVNPSIRRPDSNRENELEFMKLSKEEEDDILRQATGCFYLEEATTLNLIVDTSETSISHLGQKLPALKELHLNGSALESVRDLGTGFKNLTILWISRCALTSLDGIGSAAESIQELYASYNEIHDLSAAADLARLEVLDLEGNNVSDLEQIAFLGLCPHLTSLNLSLNPIAKKEGYREKVREALPALAFLDDEPLYPRRSSDTGSIPLDGDLNISHTGLTPSGSEDEEDDAEAAERRREVDEDDFQRQHSKTIEELRRETDALEFQSQRELELIRDGIKYTAPLLAPALQGPDDVDMGSLVRPGTAFLGGSRGGSSSGPRPDSVRSARSHAGPSPPCASNPSPSGFLPPPPPSAQANGRPGAGRPGTASSTVGGALVRPSTGNHTRPGTARSAAAAASASLGLYWRKNRIRTAGSDDWVRGEEEEAAGPPGPGGEGGSAASQLTRGRHAFTGGVAKALRKRRGEGDAASLQISDVGDMDHTHLLDELRLFKAKLDAAQNASAAVASFARAASAATSAASSSRPNSNGVAGAAPTASAGVGSYASWGFAGPPPRAGSAATGDLRGRSFTESRTGSGLGPREGAEEAEEEGDGLAQPAAIRTESGAEVFSLESERSPSPSSARSGSAVASTLGVGIRGLLGAKRPPSVSTAPTTAASGVTATTPTASTALPPRPVPAAMFGALTAAAAAVAGQTRGSGAARDRFAGPLTPTASGSLEAPGPGAVPGGGAIIANGSGPGREVPIPALRPRAVHVERA